MSVCTVSSRVSALAVGRHDPAGAGPQADVVHWWTAPGEIAAKQLESSTVDLSAEFTGLITTQRAYSASSKIITTADEMLAELINIKR